MKVLPLYLVFLVISYGAWFSADTWHGKKERELNQMRVPVGELETATDNANKKAREVIRAAGKSATGDIRAVARSLHANDLQNPQYTDDAVNRDYAKIINQIFEDEKIAGIASMQFGATNRVEINDLRGSPVAIVRVLHLIDSKLPDLRFARATWDASESSPVSHVEYDVWKPNLTPQN